MEVSGHALRKIMGRTATCQCGRNFLVRISDALKASETKLMDLAMDEHRKHLAQIEEEDND